MMRITRFEGVSNQGNEASQRPNVLREAVDVDLTDEKKVRSRPRYTAPVVATTLGHSLFADPRLPFALFADGDTLHALHPDESTSVVRTGLAVGLPLSYCVINDGVYWSSEVQSGFVSVDLEALDWACPSPAGQPGLQALPAGSFGPGKIKAALTYIDTRGRESGTVMASELDRDSSGGVRVTQIPVPPPGVAKIRVYLSDGNDPILYLHASLDPGVTQYDALDPPRGRKLGTQHLSPLPPGHIVRELNGRQFVAVGRRILWSPTLRYGLYDPAHDWVALPDRIDMMEPVGHGTGGAGLWVASGQKTYFLSGADPREFTTAIKAPYGAVPGSSAIAPASAWGADSDDPVPTWLSTAGYFCTGFPGGTLVSHREAPTADQAPPVSAVHNVGESAAAVFRETDGIRQQIVAQRGAQPHSFAVRDQVTTRVYSHEGDVQ